jgi:hypothetical protein
MGRTVPTFTMVIQEEMESWTKFRRALRREDQEAFDDLFRAARLQLAGCAYAARPIPFESVAMAMLVAQQRAIRELQQSLSAVSRLPLRPAVPLLREVPPVRAEQTGREEDADGQRLVV